MDNSNSPKVNNKGFAALWIIVVVLAVLLAVSSVLSLGAVEKQAATSDVIYLTPEESDKTEYKIFYESEEIKPDSDVGDGISKWASNTNIDLFKSSYENSKAETNVKSKNGDKVVAPGTTNVYLFTISNKGNVPLNYTIEVKALTNVFADGLPITVRMRKGSEWLIGGETEWSNVTDVDSVTCQSVLKAENSDVYAFEWKWEYESADNSLDTAYGLGAREYDSTFNLTIGTTAEVIPDAVDENGNNKVMYKRIMDPALFYTMIAGGLMIIPVSVLCVILVKKRKREVQNLNNAG